MTIRVIAAPAVTLAIAATTVLLATTANAAPPIYAQAGPPASVDGAPGANVEAKVLYKLQNPGTYSVTFGRDPLDVIFTAASPKVTFPAQDSIAVDGIPGGVSSCAVKPDTGGNELLCSIRPIGDSGPVQLSGDILFRPKVQIADDTSKGETYTGGSVLYYGEAGAPGTVTAAVNFQVAVS